MHYWEICLTIPGLDAGASLGGECFVGLVNHEMTAAGNIGSLDGSCGFMDSAVDSMRIDGEHNGHKPVGIRYFANMHKHKQLPSRVATCCENHGTHLLGALPQVTTTAAKQTLLVSV